MVEIYFENLDEGTQCALLEEYGVEEPEEMNWDVLPVTTVECDNAPIYEDPMADPEDDVTDDE